MTLKPLLLLSLALSLFGSATAQPNFRLVELRQAWTSTHGQMGMPMRVVNYYLTPGLLDRPGDKILVVSLRPTFATELVRLKSLEEVKLEGEPVLAFNIGKGPKPKVALLLPDSAQSVTDSKLSEKQTARVNKEVLGGDYQGGITSPLVLPLNKALLVNVGAVRHNLSAAGEKAVGDSSLVVLESAGPKLTISAARIGEVNSLYAVQVNSTNYLVGHNLLKSEAHVMEYIPGRSLKWIKTYQRS